jgi:hypothetical protein
MRITHEALQADLDKCADLLIERIAEIHGNGDAFEQWQDAFRIALANPSNPEAVRCAMLGLHILQHPTQ